MLEAFAAVHFAHPDYLARSCALPFDLCTLWSVASCSCFKSCGFQSCVFGRSSVALQACCSFSTLRIHIHQSSPFHCKLCKSMCALCGSAVAVFALLLNMSYVLAHAHVICAWQPSALRPAKLWLIKFERMSTVWQKGRYIYICVTDHIQIPGFPLIVSEFVIKHRVACVWLNPCKTRPFSKQYFKDMNSDSICQPKSQGFHAK